MLRSNKIIFALVFIAVGFLGNAKAQSALDGFDPNANNSVRVVLPQPDGKILIAGEFTSLAPNGGPSVTRNRIARLNPDGTLDTAFNPNANQQPICLALQADGKILVGGVFSTIGGQARNFIARLDAVTGLADSFNPNANGFVYTIAVQADGMILAGGDFTTIGGQSRGRLARLDPTTGTADALDASADALVFTLLVQADGKILVGGSFTMLGGQLRPRIARLDPTTGLPDSWNPSANNNVTCFATQADGKILVGGFFTNTGGQSRNRIARLDPNTGLADSFNPNVPGVADQVSSITVQTDGEILVGGLFTTIGGQSRNNIARLRRSTGLADGFNPNPNSFVNAKSMALQPDGKILIGGGFNTLTPNGGSALTRNRIARLETDGRADRTLDLDLGGQATYAIAVQPNGQFVIGGTFLSVSGIPRNHIARLNPDGSLDALFNPNANGLITALAVQADGKIIAGGGFTSMGGQSRNNIARLNPDGSLDAGFNPNANNFVWSIVLQADGKILVGGQFTTIGGQPLTHIARLNPDGSPDAGFNPNPDSFVFSIALQPDGKILAGGSFSSIGGQARGRLARLDAVSGASDSFDANISSTIAYAVRAIAIQADGKILVGGSFTSIGGLSRNNIGRLNPSGSLDAGFNPNANDLIRFLALQTDGRILAGGSFTSIGGQSRNRMARLDATTGLADSFNPSPSGNALSVAFQADGKLLVGGFFTTIGGATHNGFARLLNDTVATQNLNITLTSVSWTRSGSSPQASRVTFEDSTDGVNYNFLGDGTATGNNWTLTCLNLSTGQNIYIRARGIHRGGDNNGSESIQESVRNVFFLPGPTISGTVTYGNAIGAPTPRFVSNVLLTGAGSPNVMTTTAEPGPCTGTYSLTGFGSGSYTVTPTKTGGVNGITSFDAGRIAQHVAGTNILTGNALTVADVSGNGIVSSFDAAQIAQFVTSTGGMQTGTWKFIPVNRSYTSVTSSVSGEDFIALLMGEVSGNWQNTGARPVIGNR